MSSLLSDLGDSNKSFGCTARGKLRNGEIRRLCLRSPPLGETVMVSESKVLVEASKNTQGQRYLYNDVPPPL